MNNADESGGHGHIDMPIDVVKHFSVREMIKRYGVASPLWGREQSNG